MNEKELWAEFVAKNNIDTFKYEAWSFGVDADLLASLVFNGEKTATASAYLLYELEGEPLPKAGEYSIILNSENEAVCVIRTTNVYVVPFYEVSAEHAYKEGEGDKSLAYWQKVHEAFFREHLETVGLKFTVDMDVVCEEFEVVYRG